MYAYSGIRPVLKKLKESGMEVMVLSSVPVVVSGTRKKTGMLDAMIYPEIAWRDARMAWIPPPEIEELRALVRSRELLMNVKCQLRTAFNSKKNLGFGEISIELANSARAIDEQIKMIDKKIRDHLREHGLWELAERLMEIDGAGFVTAATIIAEVGNIKRFMSGNQLASYAGLAPSTYGSGGRVRHGKTGAGRLKRIMYLFAVNHVMARGRFYRFYRQMINRHKPKKEAYLAVARKLALLVFKVMNGERYRKKWERACDIDRDW